MYRSLHLTLFLFIFSCFFNHIVSLEPPVVEVVSWLETDDHKWKSGSEIEIRGITHNKTTFIIPGDIHGLSISCNASYPIEWEFAPDEHLDPNIMVFSMYPVPRREGDGTSDSPFKFSSQLFLYGDTNAFTGKYICKKVDNNWDSFYGQIQTLIYIFWEGNSPPYIMGAGKTVRVSSYLQGNVRLPCPVSFPEVDVALQRKMNVTTKTGNKTSTEVKFVDLEYTTNSSAIAPITYDPTVGFILDNTIDKNKSIDGEYKCMTAEKDDFLTVIVTPDKIITPPEHHGLNKIDSGATLYYNTTSQQFVCCSNSDKPPNIFMFWCMSYAHCRIAKPLIYHNMIDKMRQTVLYGKNTNGNCASMYIYQGAYRCSGDGIEVTRTIFSNYRNYHNGTFKRELYWSWQDITPEKQRSLVTVYLQVQQQPDSPLHLNPWYHYQSGVGPNPILYTGQNISFSCQPANFYFADGVQWRIKWRNGTSSKIILPLDPNQSRNWWWIPPKTAYVIISTQMYSVTCMAPVWNSTEWVNKEQVLKTRDPILPQITSPNADTLYWTLNETEVSIRCDATGDPAPLITWLKNGKPIIEKQNIRLVRGNGTLDLQFLVAEYEVHGSYLCVAENIASKAEKMFNIYVEEGHPWVVTTVVTCVCLIFLTILGVLGWRLKVNHDSASELKWRTS